MYVKYNSMIWYDDDVDDDDDDDDVICDVK